MPIGVVAVGDAEAAILFHADPVPCRIVAVGERAHVVGVRDGPHLAADQIAVVLDAAGVLQHDS